MQSKSPTRPGAVFGPAEITNLTEAYREALMSIDDSAAHAGVPGHELRRRLASLVIDEASRGQSDPRLIAEKALAELTK